jgi:ferritin
MEINKKIADAFNGQMKEEYYSSYLYLSMAAYFDNQNLAGFAGWMNVQSAEELKHAMKFYKHIVERNGRVMLAQIDKPKTEWSSPTEAFEDAYKHEQKITSLINDLVKLARDDKDYAAEVFLHWFVTEQIEEEEQTRTILDTLKYIGDSKQALIMLDKELGKRE